MLHMAREAEEEMAHLRRVNTRYPEEPSDVVDARVEAAVEEEELRRTQDEEDESTAAQCNELRREERQQQEAAKEERETLGRQWRRMARTADWAEWQNHADALRDEEERAERARGQQDWADWVNCQARANDDVARQREAQEYREWEQWVVLNTPPDTPRPRARSLCKMEVAVFLNGSQATKKARWMVQVPVNARIGLHFDMTPSQGGDAGNGARMDRPSDDPRDRERVSRASQGEVKPVDPVCSVGPEGHEAGGPPPVGSAGTDGAKPAGGTCVFPKCSSNGDPGPFDLNDTPS